MYLKQAQNVSAINFFSGENPAIQQGSPVTWHVAFWVLLTLATNSMAQRYAFYPDHSIYLHSSPLICIADTILSCVRVIVVSIALRVSPQKSLKITDLLRKDSYFSGGDSADDHVIHSSHHKSPQTWPRWMLFILGTLPSAIKLQSFTGLPWTRTWGSMFLTSFIVNELIAMNAKVEDQDTSIPQLLGSDTANWHEVRQDEVRDKMFRLFYLNRALNSIDKFLKNCVWLFQVTLFSRAGQQLWAILSDFLLSSVLAQWIITILTSVTCVLSGAGVFVDAYFRQRGLFKWMINERTNQSLLSQVTTPALVVALLLPKPPAWDVGDNGMRNWGYITVVVYAVYTRGYLIVSLARVCMRFPRVAMALRIERQSAKGVAAQDRAVRGMLDVTAFNSMFFFVTNILGCVLWYAYKYDPEGTLNPDWTDVFG